ncbi:toll-like receptor 6 [Amphibalanus amphitrite]|uniref:toll-like receptor 6 n=1 Tax=Amphibalanus amphitrite TaxID=1232801 RepID=UPI001C91C5FB|nr:toll-like receptor 6 [Amphibalanus amphitrite]
MTPLLLTCAALLNTVADTQAVPERTYRPDFGQLRDLQSSQATTEAGRRPAQCYWRLDAASVWECRLGAGGVESALVLPDYRSTELRVLCEDDAPGVISASMFQHVLNIIRLEIRDCAVTKVENRALWQFTYLRNLSLSSSFSSEVIISNHTFRNLTKLESVDLSGNHIEYLPPKAFCPLHRLIHLNLSDNALMDTEVGFGTGDNENCRHALRELDMSSNALRSVRARGFAQLTSLQQLILAGNRIEQLAEESFYGVGELRLLDLRANHLVTLPDGVLTPVQQLTSIQLQQNRLAVLPPRVFAGLEKLLLLNLSHNQLTSPGDFSGLPRLLQLDLSNNRLTDLLPGFRQLNSLDTLNLSHNQLTHIPVNALVSLSNLFELDLSHNQLVTLAGGSLILLRGLTVLRLDHNQLVTLQPESLSNCSGIQRLSLSHNKLADVPVALRSLSLLHELDLSHNWLLFIDDNAFHNLSSLVSLDLSHNMLTSLSQRSLAPLTSMTRLDLSYNQVRSLEGVLRENRRLSELNVAGNKLNNLEGITNWQPSFYHLPSLFSLNASANTLTMFDYRVIPTQLRQLDISNNRLLSLDGKHKHPTIELREIDASGNQISRVTRDLLPDSIEVARLANNSITDVEPYSFDGKKDLQMVDLSFNKLEHLKKVTVSVERVELRLAGNPLACDCHNEWLSEPATKLALTDLDRVMCTLEHRGQTVKRPLSEAHFLCPYKRHCFKVCQCCDYDACDCEQTCPKSCTCLRNNIWTVNVIMCANQGLTVIPSRIPMDATDIMLDGNDLNMLYDLSFLGRKSLNALFLNNSNVMSVTNRTFQGLTSLRYLHLEDNQLTRLEGEEMLNLTGLRELYLQNNHLEYINTALFKPLERLEVLDLSGNRLTQLSIWTISQPYLARVSLAGNSWVCECSFRFRFRRWLLQNRDKVADAESVACSSGDVIVVESECRGMLTAANSNMWVYVAAAAVCLAATAALLAIVAYRRLGRRSASAHKMIPPLAYDAFVSCDAKDTALASQLAADLPYLRLCLLHQDVPATPDAIVEAVNASHATVLLLTEAFIGRAWCRFDFKHAHLAALGSARRSLVLVDVADVVGAPELDPDLVMLSKSCPVLSWRDKQLGQRLMRLLRPPAGTWGAPSMPDDCSDGPVYASIDDDLARSPSTALSEKAFLAGPARMNITLNPSDRETEGFSVSNARAHGGQVLLTPNRGTQIHLTPARGRKSPLATSPGGKVQLTPSYFV